MSPLRHDKFKININDLRWPCRTVLGGWECRLIAYKGARLSAKERAARRSWCAKSCLGSRSLALSEDFSLIYCVVRCVVFGLVGRDCRLFVFALSVSVSFGLSVIVSPSVVSCSICLGALHLAHMPSAISWP